MLLRPIPLVALTLLILVWGYSWILNKTALLDAGPFTFSAYRMILASACLLAALPLTGRSLKPRGLPGLLGLGLIQTTGFVGLSMWALVEGGIGATSILVFTMPFWTLLLAWPVLGERVEGAQWWGVALAAAGLLVIMHPWDLTGTVLSKFLGLTSGFLWASGSVLVKRMQKVAPRDLLSLTAWQMALGAIPLTLIAFAINEPPVIWSARFMAILGATSLISTALGWWIWTYVLKHLDAGVAGLTMLAVPVIAIASAAWQLGERPARDEMFGMVLILSALIIIGYCAWRRHIEIAGPVGQE